jgi:hypothetical protein
MRRASSDTSIPLPQVVANLGACEVTTVITQHPLSMTPPKQQWFIKKSLYISLYSLYF